MLKINGVEIKQGVWFKHRRRNAGSINHVVFNVTDTEVSFKRLYNHEIETVTHEGFRNIFEKYLASVADVEAAYLQHHYFVLRAALGEAVDLWGLYQDLKDTYEDPYDCYDD